MPEARRYRGAMRRVVGAAAVVLGMLVLSGCGTGDPIPTLPPTPSTTPVFASEEEALAAAEDAYAAYLEIWSEIAAEGGVAPDRLAPYATGEFYDEELEGLALFRDNGWRSVGTSQVKAIELQYVDLSGSASTEVLAAYLCIDVSGVDVLDASGTSVVSPDRPDLQAFEVFFDLLDGGTLLPSSRDTWDSESVCGGS